MASKRVAANCSGENARKNGSSKSSGAERKRRKMTESQERREEKFCVACGRCGRCICCGSCVRCGWLPSEEADRQADEEEVHHHERARTSALLVASKSQKAEAEAEAEPAAGFGSANLYTDPAAVSVEGEESPVQKRDDSTLKKISRGLDLDEDLDDEDTNEPMLGLWEQRGRYTGSLF